MIYTLQLNDEEYQMLMQMLIASNPLIQKFGRQVQEQQQAAQAAAKAAQPNGPLPEEKHSHEHN